MRVKAEIDKIFSERRQGTRTAVDEPASKIKTGLHLKFTITITLMIVGMIIVLLLFFHHNALYAVRAETNHWGFQIAQSLADTVRSKLKDGVDAVQKQTEVVFNMPDVFYIVLQKQGEADLIHLQKDENFSLRVLPDEYWDNPEKRHSIYPEYKQGRLAEYLLPIDGTADITDESFRKSIIIRLGVMQKNRWQAFHLRSLTIVLFVVIFVFIGVGIAWFFSKVIIEPIQRLARAMNLVAEETMQFDENGLPMGKRFRRVNDFDLNIHTQDEIEQLADEFVVMLEKLEKSYQQLEEIIKDKNSILKEKSKLAENLKELNRKNEVIIKERTREVVEKNLRLYEIFEELQFQKEELISMNAQLEKISRMKSEFLANMSHELRTPMNSILGFTEVLREKMFGDLNERQEKYLFNIHTSGRHLLQLINNILDISKVEAGKMKLVIEPYSLNRVIDEVQNTIRTLAYKKNIHLHAELAADMVMHGDASKMKQILYNLLSNAIKFTEEKGEVLIKTEEVKPGTYFEGGPGSDAIAVDAASVLLSVRDNGIGIKPEDQERVFIEFEQADQTRKRRYEGTGLGLALTRKLVVLHRGAIWLQSDPDQGTTVFVLLPVKTQIEDTESQEGEMGV